MSQDAARPVRKLDLPDEYDQLLAYLKTQVHAARQRAHRAANTELLTLYWTIGNAIVRRQAEHGWGAKIVDRLAGDLRAAFPDMRGFSRSNLHSMRRMASCWPREAIVQQAVGQLGWSQVVLLLERLDDPEVRNWYAAAAVAHGWSRDVLANQIANRTHTRLGIAPSNFAERLPAPDSELAQQLLKDPYVFDFLGLTERVAERELEQALMDKLSATLLEFGDGFAFVGRQVPFEVDGDDFYIDLLFFHVEQLRYIVVELKIGSFVPEFAGKLGFYVTLVDNTLRRSSHAPTVGILLCASANETVVRYSLGATTSPMAVATYTYETLPPEERAALPPAEVVTAALATSIEVDGRQVSLSDYLTQAEAADRDHATDE